MGYLPLLCLMAGIRAPPPVICIDPGHPSEVGRGTQGRKTTEIKVAWKVASALAARLRREGYRVVLTKTSENQLVRNRRRAEIANDSHAALLLRLHCDASSSSGFAVFYPTRSGCAGGVVGPSSHVLASSDRLVHRFYPAMEAALQGQLASRGLQSDLKTAIGARQGSLTGSVFSHVPTILVEMVVLTNRHDEAWILSPRGFSMMEGALDASVRACVARG